MVRSLKDPDKWVPFRLSPHAIEEQKRKDERKRRQAAFDNKQFPPRQLWKMEFPSILDQNRIFTQWYAQYAARKYKAQWDAPDDECRMVAIDFGYYPDFKRTVGKTADGEPIVENRHDPLDPRNIDADGGDDDPGDVNHQNIRREETLR